MAQPSMTLSPEKPWTQLPRFLDGQWEKENPRGILYKDRTVLYTIRYGAMAEVRAAILRPCDDKWTVIQRTLESPNYREFCVAYHAGKILVTVERSLWHVVPLTRTPATASDDVLVLRPSSMPPPHNGDFCEYSYVLESRGELLWVLLYLSSDIPDECRNRGIGGVAMVSVHALKNAPDPQWVRKEGDSLADRVLFLGWPNSFAVDATQLGVAGGFVYFMYDVDEVTGGFLTHPRRGVLKYDLMKNKTELVDWAAKRMERRDVHLAHPPDHRSSNPSGFSNYSKEK